MVPTDHDFTHMSLSIYDCDHTGFDVEHILIVGAYLEGNGLSTPRQFTRSFDHLFIASLEQIETSRRIQEGAKSCRKVDPPLFCARNPDG